MAKSKINRKKQNKKMYVYCNIVITLKSVYNRLNLIRNHVSNVDLEFSVVVLLVFVTKGSRVVESILRLKLIANFHRFEI